jgi:NAD(P)-dependent dehydrogenase (short-subunit alcohol dehydrogenase family)
MRVEGARILVAGGVHRLGRHIALHLAQHGAALCVTSRGDGPDAVKAVAQLQQAGAAAARFVAADVHGQAGAAAMVRDAVTALGGLDAVVYTVSGPFVPTPPQELDEAAWQASFDAIAKGFFFTACAARNHFVSAAQAAESWHETGVIVALTDVLGVQPWAAFAAHGAAKAAEIHLVRELARAWGPDGVRVCGVAPGPVDLADDPRREASLRTAQLAALPRLVAGDDIAAGIRFCLETQGVTGINLSVDNGLLLR